MVGRCYSANKNPTISAIFVNNDNDDNVSLIEDVNSETEDCLQDKPQDLQPASLLQDQGDPGWRGI